MLNKIPNLSSTINISCETRLFVVLHIADFATSLLKGTSRCLTGINVLNLVRCVIVGSHNDLSIQCVEATTLKMQNAH